MKLHWQATFFAASAALAMGMAAFGVRAEQPTYRPATRPIPTNELHDFVFHGQLIHPACVMKLGTALADSRPAVAAVDVEGCTESQQNRAAITEQDGWTKVILEDGGWFAYRHLGVSPGGTHILRTRCSGGGSGIFEDLLLVRFQRDRVWQDSIWRDRLLMTSVGSFTLGDRDEGQIRIDGEQVVVGRSRYRKTEKVIPLDGEH